MTLTIIAAVSDNNVIGRGNALPWHLPADLKRFKALTMGHTLVMGRKTFDSIGRRPLPGRRIVVVTREELNVDGVDGVDGVKVVHSLEEALVDDAFICGGAEIYAQSIPRADRMQLTRVHAEFDGDTFFPEFDDVTDWHLADREDHEPDERNPYPYSFLLYERVARAERPIGESG
jgi:dihydrofolate reductase